MTESRRVVIAGASGLVGSQLLRLLLDTSRSGASPSDAPEIESVTALVRRRLGITNPRLHEVIVDFADAVALHAVLEQVRPTDVFCCLGTTIAKAGSQAAFRAVDLDAPLALARASLAVGAEQFLAVTAVGADAKSSIFYNRVKGELEQALHQLSFPRGVKLMHPSLLLGHRAERRPAELFAMGAMRMSARLFAGPLWRYRAIKDVQVAQALLHAALREPPGDRTYEGKSLFLLAGFAS